MASSFAVKKESSRKGKAKAVSVPAKKRDEFFSSTRIKSKKRTKAVLTSSDEEEQPLAERKQQKPSRPTIKIPVQKQSTSVHRSRKRPEESDSAGSLFSEKSEPSSPEVTLGSVVPRAQQATMTSTVPMKRPSTDDDIASAPRKRQTLEMPMLITGTAGNATKARLAQRVPQASKPVSSAPALSSSLKRDLSGMKFKKITTAAAAQSPVQSNSPVNPKPIPPLPRRSASASDHQSPAPPEQASPIVGSHAPAAAAEPELRRAPPQLPRLHQMQSPVVDSMVEASKFLSEVMPQALASPMRDEPIPEMPPPLAPKRTAPIKVTLPRSGSG
ncbi:hypothetical protein C8Q74DRAFT_167190 [Fomes fomentarius]|nr:hypothetical protein C8Q74DRAFT_167190 [Fomes fomentarius]